MENIGDFGRFILNKEKLEVEESDYRYEENVIDILEKEYKDFIRKKGNIKNFRNRLFNRKFMKIFLDKYVVSLHVSMPLRNHQI